MNTLSAAQLRFLARVRGLRPDAVLRWRTDARGWSVDVDQSLPDPGGQRLLTARLHRDGSVTASRAWL